MYPTNCRNRVYERSYGYIPGIYLASCHIYIPGTMYILRRIFSIYIERQIYKALGTICEAQDTRYPGTTVVRGVYQIQDTRCEAKHTRYLVPKDKIQDIRTIYGTRHNYT